MPVPGRGWLRTPLRISAPLWIANAKDVSLSMVHSSRIAPEALAASKKVMDLPGSGSGGQRESSRISARSGGPFGVGQNHGPDHVPHIGKSSLWSPRGLRPYVPMSLDRVAIDYQQKTVAVGIGLIDQ